MFNSYPRCRSRVYPPSSFEALTDRDKKSKQQNWKDEPSSHLELEHVFGSSGIQSTVIDVDGPASVIAFAASATVVVWDLSNRLSTNEKTSKKSIDLTQPKILLKQRHAQRIFTKHQDEVTCLCSRNNLIASSELGFTPKILVWNATTMDVLAPAIVLMERSVSCQSVKFINKSLIVALMNDQNHSVQICNWREGKVICEARSGPSLTYTILLHCIQTKDQISLVTNGKRHLRFWTYNHIDKKLLSNSTSTSSDVHCIFSSKRLKMVVAGQGNGTVTFWYQNVKSIENEGGDNDNGNEFELTTRSTLISTYGPLVEGAAVTAIALCSDNPNNSIKKTTNNNDGNDNTDTSNATDNNSESWNDINTDIFVTGQSDGAIMLHCVKIQQNGSLVISKLLSVHSSEWSGTLIAKQKGITNLLFNWNVWNRIKTSSVHSSPLKRRPRKISMGTSGKGSVGKSAFMSKNVMKHKQKHGILTTPIPPNNMNTNNNEDSVPEPLLVVGTGGGCLFIVTPKEIMPSSSKGAKGTKTGSSSMDPTVRWKSGIDVEFRHHSHGGTVECSEPLEDGKHIVSAGRDGILRIWSIDMNRDYQCRAMIGLPGLGVCVAPHKNSSNGSNGGNNGNNGNDPDYVYVGLSDGRLVKVALHYISKEEKRIQKENELRKRQKNGNRGPPRSQSNSNSNRSWRLCVVHSVDVQNPNGQAMETIQCMAMRPTGSLLAVGSRDNNVYLIDVEKMVVVKMLTGSSSFLLTIDWSLDGSLLQTNDANREILYWKITDSIIDINKSKQAASAKDARDVIFSRWTCLFGWAVSGIWSGTSDATDVNTTCRGGKNGDLLVTGDDFRNVRLYSWPCLPNATGKFYSGHHSHVMSVRFCERDGLTESGGVKLKRDWSVVSAGGLDRCVFVWKVVDN